MRGVGIRIVRTVEALEVLLLHQMPMEEVEGAHLKHALVSYRIRF